MATEGTDNKVETQIALAFTNEEKTQNIQKDKTELDGSTVKDIFFRLTVKRVSDIDTSTQRFYAEFTLRFTWIADENENEDMERAINFSNKQLHDWEPAWAPQVSFPNGLSVALNKISMGQTPFFRITKLKNGKFQVQYDMEVRAFFMEHFELRAYPFDCQDLTIICKLGNKGGMKKYHLVPDFELDAFSKIDLLYSVFTEWNLKPSVLSVTHTDPKMSKKGGMYPIILVKFKVQRKYMYYVKRIGIILAILSLSSLWSFSIDIENVAERLSFVVTLILAVVAFQFTINDSLPVVSFLTFVDRYILFSISFIFFVGCQSSILYKLLPQDSWDAVDIISFYVFAVIWLIVHIGIYININITADREEKKLGASEDEQQTLLNAIDGGVMAHHFKHNEKQENQINNGETAVFVAKTVNGSSK